jgi:hypothetical protein
MVGQSVISIISMPFGWHDSATFTLAMLPLYLLSQLGSTVFSAFISAWFIASFASLSVEARR